MRNKNIISQQMRVHGQKEHRILQALVSHVRRVCTHRRTKNQYWCVHHTCWHAGVSDGACGTRVDHPLYITRAINVPMSIQSNVSIYIASQGKKNSSQILRFALEWVYGRSMLILIGVLNFHILRISFILIEKPYLNQLTFS